MQGKSSTGYGEIVNEENYAMRNNEISFVDVV